jgi:hypothetical protein
VSEEAGAAEPRRPVVALRKAVRVAVSVALPGAPERNSPIRGLANTAQESSARRQREVIQK